MTPTTLKKEDVGDQLGSDPQIIDVRRSITVATPDQTANLEFPASGRARIVT
jgi:hypothetical protein